MSTNWQSSFLQKFIHYLHTQPAAVALATFGSITSVQTIDEWADIDAVLVVQQQALFHFFPDTTWLAPLGEILATEQYDNGQFHLLRVCFTNFQRLDLLLVTEHNLQTIDQWRTPPPWQQLKIVFVRSPAVETILQQPQPPTPFTPPTPAEFDNLVNGFWFKTAIAVHKIIRADLLIAFHLTLDLARDCAMLGMMLRDRAEGTNYHRTGGMGNTMVETLPIIQPPYNATSLLAAIAACGAHFDQLAGQWTTAYKPRSHHLTNHVKEAQTYLDITSKSDPNHVHTG